MTHHSGPARMAERRRECGLTQAQLGALIGMTQGQLSNLERKNRPAGIGTALAIARALRTTVEALWAEDVPVKRGGKRRKGR